MDIKINEFNILINKDKLKEYIYKNIFNCKILTNFEKCLIIGNIIAFIQFFNRKI